MPQIRGNSFAKIYSVVKMQQICKETKKMYVTHTFSKMSVQQGFQIVWIFDEIFEKIFDEYFDKFFDDIFDEFLDDFFYDKFF